LFGLDCYDRLLEQQLRGGATLRRDCISRDQRRQCARARSILQRQKRDSGSGEAHAACFEILHAQQLQERFHLSLMISTNIDRNEDKPKLESQVTSNEIMH
jgi:hypothetical protein